MTPTTEVGALEGWIVFALPGIFPSVNFAFSGDKTLPKFAKTIQTD